MSRKFLCMLRTQNAILFVMSKVTIRLKDVQVLRPYQELLEKLPRVLKRRNANF